MRFKLEESIKLIGSNKEIKATYSKIDLRNILENSTTPQRIVYLPDTEMWLVCSSNISLHYYMAQTAYDEGLTDIDAMEGGFGRFYYVPHKFIDLKESSKYLYNDFSEIHNVAIFDEFFIGTDTRTDPKIGTDVFFGLFKNPIFKGSVKELDSITDIS